MYILKWPSSQIWTFQWKSTQNHTKQKTAAPHVSVCVCALFFFFSFIPVAGHMHRSVYHKFIPEVEYLLTSTINPSDSDEKI